ncbi:NtaA/DmoA family FMN-dependent monooxygenase [Sediminivirga luteola]|uniref:Nitrilotriacetate monooxygenase component A n=1 Tax=Sediminivirga luteola TaxID=1774748 RepID=A0A8J2XLV6_9MICO|nr:NtaA/DmoA family FMN-dependent monooxygenase [Sediminivirga luteola]GGA25216.1 nitrilotriacetate monooxygenase component A [Sediminivirga luteola]
MTRAHAAGRQIILGAHFPGVNNTTVWSDPASGSHIAFESFRRFAQSAERGFFDFLFLAEGLRLREQRGVIHDLDVVGRPDTLPVLSGLAAVTAHLGLAGTINATYNEPYEVARQFATLDHLSAGRAAWNVVTTSDAFTGENFRRAGYLPHDQRYSRAQEFLDVARLFWDSWPDPRIEPGRVSYTGTQFDVAGYPGVPRPPQGHPVIFQAGDSAAGRDFAARNADAVFTRHGTPEAGRAFYADVKSRAQAHGRDPENLKVLPGVTFVIGDTDEDARERAAAIRAQQVSGQTAILLLEHVWNRDLSGYDPDGPLPDIEPDLSETTVFQGRARQIDDRAAEAARLRALAREKNLTLRQTVIETQSRQTFVGSPETVAEALIDAVGTRVCDGFILVPHITPAGLEPFVERVVPLLQERGALRTEYPANATLRDLLGLPYPGEAPA